MVVGTVFSFLFAVVNWIGGGGSFSDPSSAFSRHFWNDRTPILADLNGDQVADVIGRRWRVPSSEEKSIAAFDGATGASALGT